MSTYSIDREEHGTYRWLMREVGGSLGFGFAQDTWDSEKQGRVDSIVQSGVMQLYYPPQLPAPSEHKSAGPPHQWSFLTPLAEITLVSGTTVYDLPENFSGAIGGFTHKTGATTARISVVDESMMRQLFATAAASGSPSYSAIRPKPSDGTAKQRYQVVFYPTPDATITLEYRYSVSPEPLSVERPYPACGRQHAETLLQSCLAVAEERETKTQGASTAKFMERLAASIMLDSASAASTESGVWPLEDRPDDLTVDLNHLRRLVGRRMEYGPHPGSWTHSQENEVSEVIATGLRRFYTPPMLPNSRVVHQWSFLTPTGTINTADSVGDYDLPEDFGFIDGPLTYNNSDISLSGCIKVVSEFQVRRARQYGDSSGYPTSAAVVVKDPVGTVGTRWKLMLSPIPTAAYTINYRYKTNPGLLSVGISEPVGGMPHAQTVIESCLWAADEFLGRDKSPHRERFIECVMASVSHDKLAKSPDNLGHNGDNSDTDATLGFRWDEYSHRSLRAVPVNGVIY